MAIIQIPHDMTELRVKMEQLKMDGRTVDEDTMINQAVVDNAQELLDEILDGHYYTCKMEDDHIAVFDVINLPAGQVVPISESFKNDFIKDADALWDYLATKLNQVAGGR